MNLGIDCDGVIANFTKAYAQALIEATGKNLLPDTFTGDDDLNFPLTWYWERDLGYTEAEERATWNSQILSSDSFWRDLEPLPGAQDCLRQLQRLGREGHHVIFITNRFGKDVREQTETFLINNGYADPLYRPMVAIAKDKLPIINAFGIDFFIDDKPETIMDVSARCRVPHLFLKDAPYNRDCQAGTRITSLSDALRKVGLWQEAPAKRPVGRPKKSSST